MKLKEKSPKLKVLLGVGGWNMGSALFTQMVANSQNRKMFYTNAFSFLRTRNFDGLDIAWNYPGSRGSPAIDKTNYVLLLQVNCLASTLFYLFINSFLFVHFLF